MGGDAVADIAAARRRRAARDTGRCSTCGGYRAICQPEGKPCVLIEEDEPPAEIATEGALRLWLHVVNPS